MRAVAKAMHDFVSGFGLPAYTTQSVPDDIQVPYLIYPLSEPEWDQKTSWYIQGWFRSTSNAALAETADQIISAIGTGIRIDMDVGYLSIYPDTPLVQLMHDGDFRSFYISLSINAYQMPGAFPVTPSDDSDETGETPEEGENSDD